MRLERLFHFCGARLKDIEQIPVTAFKIFQHLGQLFRGNLRLKPENPVDDMVGSNFIRLV